MTMWPESMKVGPIREWPGALTRERRESPFRATLTQTLKVLDREIYELVDTKAQQESAELLIAIAPGGFRLDGRPRADARPEHPGVIFSIESRHGALSYPCDSYTSWQDNLRAIALALEALRKVDRYGVTRHGEQYRGFLALEAGTSAVAGFRSAADAHAFLVGVVAGAYGSGLAAELDVHGLLRRAKRATHPDTGSDAASFQRVSLAEAKLRAEGRI